MGSIPRSPSSSPPFPLQHNFPPKPPTAISMASRFQAASLVASPAYPNAVAWSDDNLVAVASGHLVTILNPALPLGPRGLVAIQSSEAFPIGLVDRNDLLSASLLPTSLVRDARLCVRSISWSPLGLAPNSGCLLAVCTVEGRVKLYRPPYCDYSAEWIEVVDVSNRLCAYLQSTGFGFGFSFREMEIGSMEDESVQIHTGEQTGRKRRKVNFSNFVETETAVPEENNSKLIDYGSKTKVKTVKQTPEKKTMPVINADTYVRRSAMLSSLVVAWSPVLRSVAQNVSSMSLLAVGGKSGTVSLWRVSLPEEYSIERNQAQTTMVLVGILEAHDSWITTICWAMLDPRSSNPRVVLVTGSCDGSVKIWLAHNEQLMESGESNHASFSLLKEVVNVDLVPVSVMSVTIPAEFSSKILLAVGKGSGSFEVWVCDVSKSQFDKVGRYDAHDHVVTCLAWAFDGCCLYSCSQDNFVRSWILCEDVLSEAPIPSNTPCLKSSSELPDTYASCHGLAVSPGNLVIAVVRNFDEDFLNQMYQKRTQKAAIEFFWLGAQEISAVSNDSSSFIVSGFPIKELASWKVNILWSLQEYESQYKPLILWDIIAALLAFKHCAAEYVDHLLMTWLVASSIRSHTDLSAKNGLKHVSKNFSGISTRKLHLLNIICRLVVLSGLKTDELNCEMQNSEGPDLSDEKLTVWIDLLKSSERELRQRLVCLSFSGFTNRKSHSSSDRSFVGLVQMEEWLQLNKDHVKDELRVQALEAQKHEKRLKSQKNAATEQCSYCSAPVPFESPEAAFCKGVSLRHKLPRCAVSMKICPNTPTWFCICCHRRVFTLPISTLFTLPRYPSDPDTSPDPSELGAPKPVCPFCGILLQRLQPDFLLSPSPV